MDELSELVDNGDMTTSTRARNRKAQIVDRPDDLNELLKFALFLENHSSDAVLLGPDGEQVPLPQSVYEVLLQVVNAMDAGSSVLIEPIDRQLTTQQTADLLGISRSTVIRLLEEDELPFERLGDSRHRRLRLNDVVAYRERKAAERESRLNDLTRQAHEDGLYEMSADDYREALKAARKS